MQPAVAYIGGSALTRNFLAQKAPIFPGGAEEMSSMYENHKSEAHSRVRGGTRRGGAWKQEDTGVRELQKAEDSHVKK